MGKHGLGKAPAHWNPRCRRESLETKLTRIIWQKLRDKCINPKSSCYKNYGAIGIRLHYSWHEFEAFLADVGNRPSIFHSIRRIDRRGHFEPGNCRWEKRIETRYLKVHERVADHYAFIKRGRFDWDAWRAAGSPEIA